MYVPRCFSMCTSYPSGRPHYSPSTKAWVGVCPCPSLRRPLPTLRARSPHSQLQGLPAPWPAQPDPGPELRDSEAHPEDCTPGPVPRGRLPG